ncbi:hypothetical protein EV175_005583, partial [Coemansia sp. RSA 1933]
MSGTDGSKRQRTDDRQSQSTSPELSISPKAYSSSAPNLPQIATQETTMPAVVSTEPQSDLDFRGLLERLVASQERLADDVARLQTTIDAVLTTLRQPQFAHGHSHYPHQSLARDHRLSIPLVKQTSRNSPPLSNLFISSSQNVDQLSPATTVSTPAVHGMMAACGKSPAASSTSAVASISPNPQSRHPSFAGSTDDSGHGAGSYRVAAVSGSHAYSHDYHRTGNPASNYYSTPPPPPTAEAAHQSMSSSITLPPPAALSRVGQPTPGHSHTPIPRIRSPPPGPPSSIHGRQYPHPHAFTQQQQHQQQHQHHVLVHPPPSATAMSAPLGASSSLHSSSRYHSQPLPQLQAQQQQHKKNVSRFPHQGHMHYNARPASASPHRMQQRIEQSVSLPPIICTAAPSSAAAVSAVVGYGGYGGADDGSSSARGFAMLQKPVTPRGAAAGPLPYLPTSSSFVSGMPVDATSTASKPSPSPQSATLPSFSSVSRVPPPALNTDASTPTSGGMVESPRGSSAGASGSRSLHHHQQQQHQHASMGPGGQSFSTDASSSQGTTVLAQNKVEKNRFQANIRSFVDHYFTAPANPRWDYQQSFKAPRNAQTTQQIIEVFHSAHGGTYERIEHGLGVYFSSLKAKHRTTEDKAMLKQQRDRRRARRIKKAAGRRKVFDQSRYPFLPPDFDTRACFIPVAMSPEHTDDDGDVKVGVLPWRRDTFTKLFKHLDTLRPKRTPRPNNTNLSDRSVPPSDIPPYMVDPAYIPVDRAERGSHGPEEDIEMESLSESDEMHGSPPLPSSFA